MNETSKLDDARSEFDERVVELADFEPDIRLEEWAEKYRLGELVLGPIFWAPIDVLSPVHTVGKGRTNLTLIRPTIVQTDAATPYAGFDRRESPTRNPAVSIHFEPAAYGITGAGTYVCTFSVESGGPVTLNADGYAAGGTVVGAGPRSVTGKQTVSITLKNLPASGGSASVEQTAGASWSWYSTRISYPPLVFEQVG
ncbi:hypothetical protein ACWGST_01305 [Agromyces sp. NPDC055520]